jgi:hypothetical protein
MSYESQWDQAWHLTLTLCTMLTVNDGTVTLCSNHIHSKKTNYMSGSKSLRRSWRGRFIQLFKSDQACSENFIELDLKLHNPASGYNCRDLLFVSIRRTNQKHWSVRVSSSDRFGDLFDRRFPAMFRRIGPCKMLKRNKY